MDVVLLSASNPRAERMGNGDGSQIPGKFPIGKPSMATVVIIYVWRLGRFATVDFWAAAHCTLCLLLNMAVEGEVASLWHPHRQSIQSIPVWGSCGHRRHSQNNEISDAILRGLNIQHTA